MAKKLICDYCDKETNELYEVEIHYPSFTTTDLICNECLEDLKHEVEEYVILGKVG